MDIEIGRSTMRKGNAKIKLNMKFNFNTYINNYYKLTLNP